MKETRWSWPGPNPEDYEERLAKIKSGGEETIWGALWYKSPQSLVVGLISAALGLGWDWLIGPSLTIAGLPPWMGIAPPLVGATIVVLYAILIGAFYGMLLLGAVRRMADGRLPMWGEQVVRVEARLAWWARIIVQAVILFLILLALLSAYELSAWFAKGMPTRSSADWETFLGFCSGALLLSLVGSVAMTALEFTERAYEFLKRILLPYPALWRLVCGVVGLIYGAVFWIVGALIAAGVSKAHTALGLEPILTLGTLIGLLGPSAVLGLSLVDWDGPRMDEVDKVVVEKARKTGLVDFKKWNIAPETSFDGIAANGYPFYLWRESADSRIGVARPRYCCIAVDNDELYFEFFNPSAEPQSSGALAVFILAGGAWLAASLVSYFVLGEHFLKSTSPYVTPPALAVLSAVFGGGIIGGISAGIWHVCGLALRWQRNRFEGDARLHRIPLAALAGFSELGAGEAGAIVNGEPAKAGHGLAAAFTDGSETVLTGNAWNRRSMVDMHQRLTSMFREPRDQMIAEFADKLKKARQAQDATDGKSVQASRDGIPDAL